MRLPMSRLLIVLISSAMLTGCVSGPTALEKRLDVIPETQRGYIVGTYAVDCKLFKSSCEQVFNSISARYHMVSNVAIHGRLNWTVGSLFVDDTVHDYLNATEGHKGFHFCVALPPGDYKFFSVEYYNVAGGGSGYSLREEDYFSLPFTVRPGEMADVGTIHVTTTTGRNVFRMPLPAPGVMRVAPPATQLASSVLAKCPDTAKSMSVRPSPLRLAPGTASSFVEGGGW
jgi:hypothetical protein